jgi:hypothetical protein
MHLPDGWYPVGKDDARRFEAELASEVSSQHQLFGVSVECTARRKDRDDFLFSLVGSASLAVVHLTWRPEKLPDFPWTTMFSSEGDFRTNWRKIFE